METRAARSRGEVIALVIVALTAAAFLAISAGRIAAPFGDSDEGINAAVWSTNARALRDLGPLESHLGGRREDGSRYATHPPTIVVATAIAQTVAGDHPWSSRAPAWIATVVALGLLYVLGRRAGFGPLAAGGAVVAIGLSPMVLAYGSMLDTPVVCLPFGLVVALCWYRAWTASPNRQAEQPQRWFSLAMPGGASRMSGGASRMSGGASRMSGGGGVGPGWVALACVAAGLAGWQAATLTALCGLSLAARALRHRPGALRAALPFLVGGAVGVGLSLTWSWWVYGDFHTLATKFGGRSGESGGVGLSDMVSFQVPWLFNLLGLSIIGLVGCAVALRDRRVRPLAALALASVGLYAIVFRQAAAGHQYWNYWAVFPAAIGWGYLLQLLADALTGTDDHEGTRRAVVAVGLVVVGVCAFNLARTNQALDYIVDGRRAADLVERTSFLDGQTTLPYVGEPYRPDAWISYNTRRSPVAVTSDDQLRAVAADQPDALVLVLGSCPADDPSFAFCSSIVAPGDPARASQNNPPQLLAAAELVHRLERSGD